jgi:hypothetical protein
LLYLILIGFEDNDRAYDKKDGVRRGSIIPEAGVAKQAPEERPREVLSCAIGEAACRHKCEMPSRHGDTWQRHLAL